MTSYEITISFQLYSENVCGIKVIEVEVWLTSDK